MAPPGDSKTFFKAEGGRGQQSPNDLQEMVAKANKLGGSDLNFYFLNYSGSWEGFFQVVCLVWGL